MTQGAHRRAERFEFAEERNTAVYVCRRVHDGAPILSVTHDGDGDWQFLCGGTHEDGGEDGAVLACLECVVADDPTLNEVADLCGNWNATRGEVGGAWTRHDAMEDLIAAGVDEHGWYVIKVDADDDGPGFAYTIGLYRTFEHPELICVGLRPDVMHAMLEGCVELIRSGQRLPVDTPFAGILDDHDVRLREVHAKETCDQHLGYAIWFHGGRAFPVLQLVWPDKQGVFPGEPDAHPGLATQQPLLP
jgi:hypothetical protein